MPRGDFPPTQIDVFPTLSRIATPTAVVADNAGDYNACQIFVSVTVDGAAASVVFNFDTYNRRSGTWVEILESAAVADVVEKVYQIGGVGTAVANVSTALHPGSRIRIRPVHADTDAITYQVTLAWLNA